MLEPRVADLQNALGSGISPVSRGSEGEHDRTLVPGGSPEKSSWNVIGPSSEFLRSRIRHPEKLNYPLIIMLYQDTLLNVPGVGVDVDVDTIKCLPWSGPGVPKIIPPPACV